MKLNFEVFNSDFFKKKNIIRDIEELRNDGTPQSLMLSSRSVDNIREVIPSLFYYTRVFSARSVVRFDPDALKIYFPTENGKMTSKTEEFTLDHSQFCRLIDAGWIDGKMSKGDYANFYNRSYTEHESHERYVTSLTRLGYGSYLSSLLYRNDEFEYDICSTLGLPTESVEGPFSDSILEDAVEFLAIHHPRIVVEKDNDQSDMVPFYETAISPVCNTTLVDRTIDMVYVQSVVHDIVNDGAFALCVDATQHEVEIEGEQTVVHLEAESPTVGYMTCTLSLYDRVAEVTSPQNMLSYTSKKKKYEIRHRKMVSRVIDLRSVRQMLISAAVKHKKIQKYNPRQYVYLNVHVFGTMKITCNVYCKGNKAKEKGPFLLYKGPLFREGKEYWGCYTPRYTQKVSPMTTERFSYVRVKGELYASKEVFKRFPVSLTTTSRQLISPLHRCIRVISCDCPVHREGCGISFEHKEYSFIKIPPVCYNLQPDLVEYVIVWLNTRYKIDNGVWVYIPEETPLPVVSSNSESTKVLEDEDVRSDLLDYSKVFFIKPT